MRNLREVRIQDHRGPTEFASSQSFSTFTLSPISQRRSVRPAAIARMKARAPVSRSRAVQNRALANVRPEEATRCLSSTLRSLCRGRGPRDPFLNLKPLGMDLDEADHI
jgi:cytochrome c oxidase assembly protein Cox11